MCGDAKTNFLVEVLVIWKCKFGLFGITEILNEMKIQVLFVIQDRVMGFVLGQNCIKSLWGTQATTRINVQILILPKTDSKMGKRRNQRGGKNNGSLSSEMDKAVSIKNYKKS